MSDRVMSRRRKLVFGLAASIAAPGALFGQAAKRIPRVAVVMFGTRDQHGSYLDAFIKRMAQVGYADGRNVALEVVWAEGREEKLPEILAKVVFGKPVAMTIGIVAVAALAARTAPVPPTTMTSGLPRTTCARISGSFSSRPSAQTTSRATLRPSAYPNCAILLMKASR